MNIFLNMHKTERGKSILEAMMIEGFVTISDSAYDSIRHMDRVLKGDKK